MKLKASSKEEVRRANAIILLNGKDILMLKLHGNLSLTFQVVNKLLIIFKDLLNLWNRKKVKIETNQLPKKQNKKIKIYKL
jgi:hypothetical protein